MSRFYEVLFAKAIGLMCGAIAAGVGANWPDLPLLLVVTACLLIVGLVMWVAPIGYTAAQEEMAIREEMQKLIVWSAL